MLAEFGPARRCLVLAGSLTGLAGTALAVDGVGGLHRLLEAAHSAVPYLLLMAALVVLARVLRPVSLIALPIGLMILSGLMLAGRYGWWSAMDPASLSLTLAVAGVGVATFAVPLRNDLSGPAVRRRAVCWPRTYRSSDTAPGHIHVTATLARSVVDLTTATYAHDDVIEVFVHRWGGRFELRVSDEWLILVGRVRQSLAGLMPDGDVDSATPYRYPAGEDRSAILKLIDAKPAAASGRRRRAVVVHVSGYGGRVRAVKRSS